MEEVISILYRVIRTLNGIDVRGKDNLNALLGSIQALEKVHEALTEANKKAADNAREKN